MKLSIIIPTYNRHKILIKTLDYLLKQKQFIEEIILVDQSEEVPADFHTFIKTQPLINYFHISRPNTPNARNYGLKRAKNDIILFLDDDIIPSENLIQTHLNNYKDSSIGGITGRVIAPSQKGVHTNTIPNQITKTGNIIVNWTSRQRCPVNTVAGGNVSFRKDLVEKTGYFDDNYIGNAMREESDFAYRFVKKEYKIIFDPKAEIIHLSYPAGGSRQKTRLDWYFDFFHNEFYFFFKFFPSYFLPLLILRKTRPILACIFYYGKGSWKAIQIPFKAYRLAQKHIKESYAK